MKPDRVPSGESAPSRRAAYAVLILIMIAGGSLRLLGSRGDLWLDEVWSLDIARSVQSVPQIFTAPIDNNHPLNTILMHWLRPDAPMGLYRLPSVLAGLATIGLAWLAMRPRGLETAMIAAMLVAFSFPLIVYGSEARGYSLMLMFALLSYVSLRRYFESASLASNLIFCASVLLGMISHLTFLATYLALAAWTLFELRRRPRWVHTARLHAVPIAGIAWLYYGFARHIRVGGAPAGTIADCLRETAAYALNLRPIPLAGNMILGMLAIFLLVGLWRMAVTGRGHAVFYSIAIVLGPAAVLAAQYVLLGRQETLFPRYFLTPMLFFLLMTANWIGELAGVSTSFKAMAGVVMIALLLPGLSETRRFLAGRRGNYSQALQDMAAVDPSPILMIASDNDFRTSKLLNYYQGFLPAGRGVRYIASADRTAMTPGWYIINLPQTGAPLQRVIEGPGVRLELQREYPYYGPSGWSWYVYRNVPADPENASDGGGSG